MLGPLSLLNTIASTGDLVLSTASLKYVCNLTESDLDPDVISFFSYSSNAIYCIRTEFPDSVIGVNAMLIVVGLLGVIVYAIFKYTRPARLQRGDTLTPNGTLALICNVCVDGDKMCGEEEGEHMHEG